MKTKGKKKSVGKLYLIERGTAKVLDRRDSDEMEFLEMFKGVALRALNERLSPAVFHELYIKPLTDAGMEVEAALDLLLDGAVMPN